MWPCPAKFLLIALALPLMASSQQQRLLSIQVTEEEIGQFVEELRQHNPPMDVPLNFQGHTATRDTKDQAPEEFGTHFNAPNEEFTLASSKTSGRVI
jgi:hypothetical protein